MNASPDDSGINIPALSADCQQDVHDLKDDLSDLSDRIGRAFDCENWLTLKLSWNLLRLKMNQQCSKRILTTSLTPPRRRDSQKESHERQERLVSVSTTDYHKSPICKSRLSISQQVTRTLVCRTQFHRTWTTQQRSIVCLR